MPAQPSTASVAPVATVAPDERRVSAFSLGVAAFSTVVEWYDFTLYLYVTTILARVFFGGGDGGVGIVLLGFAVSYVMRPVGAMVFGHLGDRYGRRVMMLTSMGLMSVAMLATALLPTREAIGPSAAWLLLGLRLLMAFSVGGEYTGVVAYLMEGAPDRRRGFVASFAAAASEVGALLAAAVTTVTVHLVDPAALDAWGWRIPFFAGAILAAGVLLARSGMAESPAFEGQQAEGRTSSSPVADTLRHHFPAVARTFAISALGSITYYVGITYVPTFLQRGGAFSERDALTLSTIAAFAVILVTPLFGWAADRWGRRPALVGVTIAALVLPLSMFQLMRGSWTWGIVGVVLLAWVAGGVSAVAASATPEQFPSQGRLSGLALGVTVATAVFGGLTPWVAEVLLRATGWDAVPGAMIALVALAVLPIMWRMPETAPGHTKAESAPR